MSKRVCYLHAGTHKTGTTTIQEILTREPGILEARGLYVPRAGRWGALGGHHAVEEAFNGDPKFDPANGDFAAIVREIADCGAHTVIISSENLEYLHARPDVLERMRDALEAAGYEARVILYFRPQVDYAESLYAELLKHGHDESLDAFAAEILASGSIAFGSLGRIFRFDYASLANAFARVFGRERVLARRYDRTLPPEALIADFFGLMQWPPEDVGALGVAPQLNQRARPVGYFAHLRTADILRFVLRFSPDRRLLARDYGADIPIVSPDRVWRGPFTPPPLQA